MMHLNQAAFLRLSETLVKNQKGCVDFFQANVYSDFARHPTSEKLG